MQIAIAVVWILWAVALFAVDSYYGSVWDRRSLSIMIPATAIFSILAGVYEGVGASVGVWIMFGAIGLWLGRD